MNNDHTRRNFLGTCVALAAGSALDADAQRRSSIRVHASPVKLCVASYTFRNFKRDQVIRNLALLKVDALNAKDVQDHLPFDPAEEASAVADYKAVGVMLHAAGTIDFSNVDAASIRKKLEYCRRAGIRVIVAGAPRLEDLPTIEKVAEEYDMRIAIHNHGPEDKLWHSPLDVLRAVRGMGTHMGCCMDVGHAARAGTDVVAAIQEAGPRLFNMHIKDLSDFNSKESQVAVGDGIMPVRSIFQSLIDMRYEGFVDLEYEIDASDPLPGATKSFAYMRGVLAGMGCAATPPSSTSHPNE